MKRDAQDREPRGTLTTGTAGDRAGAAGAWIVARWMQSGGAHPNRSIRMTIRDTARPLAAFAVLCAALGGCDLEQSCPDIYVPDALIISLDDTPAADETWTLDISLDGQPHCTLTWVGGALEPDDGCGEGDAWPLDDTPGFTRVSIPDFTPDQLTLALTIDGRSAGEVQAAPIYRTVEDEGLCSITQEAQVDFEVQRPL